MYINQIFRAGGINKEKPCVQQRREDIRVGTD